MLKTLPLTVTRQVVHTGARAYHRAIEGSVTVSLYLNLQQSFAAKSDRARLACVCGEHLSFSHILSPFLSVFIPGRGLPPLAFPWPHPKFQQSSYKSSGNQITREIRIQDGKQEKIGHNFGEFAPGVLSGLVLSCNPCVEWELGIWAHTRSTNIC